MVSPKLSSWLVLESAIGLGQGGRKTGGCAKHLI